MSYVVSASDWIIPLIMVGIILYGLLQGLNVFEVFIEGALEGLKIVVNILPTLIGLLVAVGMLKSSGALKGLCLALAPLFNHTHFPPVVIPVILMHSFSSSAAVGLIVDLFKTYGPDSFIGRLTSIIFGSTETIFYTLSLYLMVIKVKKSRYILPGAILSTLVSVVVAYFLTLKFFSL